MPSPLSQIGPAALDRMTDTMSDAEISAHFGLSRTAATHLRNQYGILSFSQKHGKRKYKEVYKFKPGLQRAFSYRMCGANEHYFDKVTSPRQAYWLGLLLADGWIVTHKGALTGFALALHERDLSLLQVFAEDLGCPQLVRRERKGSSLYQVKLTSEVAANKLQELGVIPKKSKNIQLPLLDRSLMPHLIRGYFDGDGSIQVRKNALTMQITSGSEQMLLDVGSLLLREIGARTRVGRDRSAFVLRAYAANAIKFGRYMYGDSEHCEISMTRKKEKFMEYLLSDAGRSWERLLSDLDSAPSR